MKTKSLFLLSLALIIYTNLAASERLGMFIDVKRYFDEAKNTTYVIDYQVPYKNMMFLQRDNSYFAELKVVISIANADSVIVTKEFINNIGVTRKYDVTSSNKSYLDRITLTLAMPGFSLQVDFEDLNADKSYSWSYFNEQLNPSDKLSDIELLTTVSSDTLSFSQKFRRNNMIHIPDASRLISKELHDSIYFYCEAYEIEDESARAVMTIKKEDTTYQIVSLKLEKSDAGQPLLFPINISNLESGRCSATIDLYDPEKVFSRETVYFITEQTETLYFLFTDAEDEYQLLRYFVNVVSSTNWRTMSKEAKRRYISNVWASVAAQLNQTVEDVLKTYKQRVDYANARFSHFERGWKSDMGRVYIRNGPPSDIDEDTTSDETRFVRKDFQIWKYTGRNRAVYVFVDIPMNGNYKLVYASNDEQESTYPNWRRYLGTDFDENRLDN